MKLLDILLKELKEWPEQATAAAQSEADREIYFLYPSVRYSHADYYSNHTADVRGWMGKVTKEEWLAAKQLSRTLHYLCPTCNYPYKDEFDARHCCELETIRIHSCTDCGRKYTSYESAEICCRSISKKSKVDVKTVLYAAFDLLNSHREISDNDYTHVGSNSLDDIAGLLQDFIDQNEIGRY